MNFRCNCNWLSILCGVPFPFLKQGQTTDLSGREYCGRQLESDCLLICWTSLGWAVSCEPNVSLSLLCVLFVAGQIELKSNDFSLTSQKCKLSLDFTLTKFLDPAYYHMMCFSCPCKCVPLSVDICCSFLLKFEFPHPVLWLVDSFLPVYVSRPSLVATSSRKPSLTLKFRFRRCHCFLCICCPYCSHCWASVEQCEVLIKCLWRKRPVMNKQREMGKYKSHSGDKIYPALIQPSH